jgi:hypothetical protein
MLKEVSLKYLKNSCFGREFFPNFDFLMMFIECSGDVGTPNFGEMKGRRLTLPKRRLYNNGPLAKLLRASF